MADVALWAILAFAYLLGCVVSGVMLSRIGAAMSSTIDDSWTGDDFLDLLSVLVWPVTFFVAAAITFGSVAGQMISRRIL